MMDEESVNRAKKMRSNGHSYYEIAKAFGCAPESVRRHLDPEWYEQKKAKDRVKYRNRRRQRKPGSEIFHFERVMSAGVREDAERLAEEIPDDTRDLTARVFGDPLPGRSALDRMRAGM